MLCQILLINMDKIELSMGSGNTHKITAKYKLFRGVVRALNLK